MNNDSLLREKRKTLPPPPIIQEIRREYIQKQIEVIHSEKHKDFTWLTVGHEPTEHDLYNHFANGGGAVNFCIHFWREFWRKRGVEDDDKSSWLEFWRLRKEELSLKKETKKRNGFQRAH